MKNLPAEETSGACRPGPEPGVVIVGAGQGGGEIAGMLRQQGYQGRITLIGDEEYAPYRRPPLSKTFLSGEASLESLYLKPLQAYRKQETECRFGIGVEAIDRKERRISLFDGTELAYSQLVLAVGGRARRLSLPGADHDNVHYVRTVNDILRLKAHFTPGQRLVVIGGGYIGLEAASVAVKKGLKVTVVETMARVLARVTAPELSGFYERVHREHGVEVRTGVGVHGFEGMQQVHTILLSNGERIPADLVIVGIGLIPNTEIAAAADLEVSDGIVVDSHCRTADPNIYAIGDCANHENDFLRRRLRLESVPSAMEQARVCAASICGKPATCTAVPWFWSDQYDLKLQMAGLSQGYDRLVVRGDINGESFSVFYLRKHVLIAADAVNRPQEFMLARKLIADRRRPDPRKLADEAVALRELAQ